MASKARPAGSTTNGLTELAEPRPVQRSLLGPQIADALRRDILFGVLKPGTRLSQQQLCERFGLSRMPVRDGLRILAHEGVVAADDAQHMIVAPLSRDDLLDAFWIEGNLTGLAAVRASERASEQDLDGFTGLHHAMLHAVAHEQYGQMADLNWSLHRSINKLSGSRKLLAAIRSQSIDLPRDYLIELPEWSSKSNAEHDAIITAMRERRHHDVGTLMTEHVVDSGRGLVDLLVERGLDLS